MPTLSYWLIYFDMIIRFMDNFQNMKHKYNIGLGIDFASYPLPILIGFIGYWI